MADLHPATVNQTVSALFARAARFEHAPNSSYAFCVGVGPDSEADSVVSESIARTTYHGCLEGRRRTDASQGMSAMLMRRENWKEARGRLMIGGRAEQTSHPSKGKET